MPALSPDEIKAATRRYMDELYNKGNTAVVNEQLAPNFVYHTALPPITPDREGIIQEAIMLRTAFPDLHVSLDDLLVEGDRLVFRWTMRGTHEGDFLGVPATHKQVTFSGLTLGRNVEDKTVEAWNFPGTLSLFQQMGAFPQPAIVQQPSAGQQQAQA
ncbi:MAG: ester cyclase [Nitrososphaerota archaeon]